MEWTVYTGRHDAATNLAIDEYLLEQAEKGTASLRVFEFEQPAVILARNESYDDILTEAPGVEYTRRDSGGSVIYCDENAIFYTITRPAGVEEFPENLHHDHFGPAIADALINVGVNPDIIGIGEHFSIRLDGRTVAGNSQRKTGEAIMYHGVLAVDPWDVDQLDELIKLREQDGQSEADFIRGLPGVSEYTNHTDRDHLKADLTAAIISAVTDDAYTTGDLSETDWTAIQEKVADKYGDRDWIENGTGTNTLKADQGFCFVDWTDEWNEDISTSGFY